MKRTYRREPVEYNGPQRLHADERLVAMIITQFGDKAIIETETPFRSRIATHPSRTRFIKMK